METVSRGGSLIYFIQDMTLYLMVAYTFRIIQELLTFALCVGVITVAMCILLCLFAC